MRSIVHTRSLTTLGSAERWSVRFSRSLSSRFVTTFPLVGCGELAVRPRVAPSLPCRIADRLGQPLLSEQLFTLILAGTDSSRQPRPAFAEQFRCLLSLRRPDSSFRRSIVPSLPYLDTPLAAFLSQSSFFLLVPLSLSLPSLSPFLLSLSSLLPPSPTPIPLSFSLSLPSAYLYSPFLLLSFSYFLPFLFFSLSARIVAQPASGDASASRRDYCRGIRDATEIRRAAGGPAASYEPRPGVREPDLSLPY